MTEDNKKELGSTEGLKNGELNVIMSNQSGVTASIFHNRIEETIVNKWHPIKTAPKDGSHILLYFDGDLAEGYFDYEESKEFVPISLSSHGCGCCGSDNPPPTYWMPLPTKPIECEV